MNQTKAQSKPPPFQTYFQAETYLEKQGYHCDESGIWTNGNMIAAVAAKQHGIQVEFEPTKH
ncbi:hypothetical protein N2V14_004092 [Vibrio fluvialis]|nr:hypothetical protein [Vibrio fluvialis]